MERETAEAIARAEALRGTTAAELLDVESIRVVKYLCTGQTGVLN
jgi:hypothetical protein